jgi:hypothetical protein
MTPNSFDGASFPGRRSTDGARSTAVSHQTVKLTRGRHIPDGGACVMELASMLAGEPFSDHPASVCPVIGSFLRAYNDSIDDQRRQDLYAYASKVVGSRSLFDEVQRVRADWLVAWASEQRPRRFTRLLRRFVLRSRARRLTDPLEAGTWAVRAIRRHTDQSHASALALIDELVALGRGEDASLLVGGDVGGSDPSTEKPLDGSAESAARSDQQRATIRLRRMRHTAT